MSKLSLDRRAALFGAGALGLTAAGGLGGGAAWARAPLLKTQAPAYYRFSHGGMQVTMVSDGPLPLGAPAGNFLGASDAEISKMLTDNFLSPSTIVLDQNIPVVNTGKNLIVFDTGMGTSKMFGPTTGRLVASLREAGIRPATVDSVVCTHAHIDHIGGLVDARGRKNFPNATVYLSEADYKFWTDESEVKGKPKAFVEHARKNLLPYKNQLKFVKDGEEFLPGITAIAAPGHTIGHTVYMLESNGKKLCFIGDLAHHQVLLIERPRLEFAYDTDPKQSVGSRVRVLEMLAKDRIPLLAYHFAWPGFGHVAKQGEGFHYYSAPLEHVIVPPPAPKKA